MADTIITPTELKIICRQAAASQKMGMAGFEPTARQVYFLILVWLSKKNKTGQCVEELLAGQDVTILSERAQQVAYHLGEWGATVSKLKQGDEKEWELLRLQLEKVVRYYPCSSKEAKAEALQKSLVKLFDLLYKMAPWSELEKMDVAAFVLNHRTTLTNLYDFGSPFYAYAKRLVYNELITQLRQENRHMALFTSLNDSDSPGAALTITISIGEAEEAGAQTFRLQLKNDIAKLLDIIQHSLRPKPVQVMLQTLSRRDEFWRALKEAGLSAPPGLSRTSGLATDAAIAQTLGMTENNVRVHRSHVKKRVTEVDPGLGQLLESLIAPHGKITYMPLN
jgi:DNA-directed RNA polymerase specialized sigma24 family protein